MTEAVNAVRRHVLDGVDGAPGTDFIAPATGFAMRRAPTVARHVLRLAPAEAARLGEVLGFDVTQAINTARGHETFASGTPRVSLRLGPDEWLLIGDLVKQPDTVADGVKLVDISHRNVALEIRGEAVRDVLSTGTPIDLHDSAFQVGTGTRTLFGKAEIIIVRCPDEAGQSTFRLECWRSFARYLAAHLQDSAALLGVLR